MSDKTAAAILAAAQFTKQGRQDSDALKNAYTYWLAVVSGQAPTVPPVKPPMSPQERLMRHALDENK